MQQRIAFIASRSSRHAIDARRYFSLLELTDISDLIDDGETNLKGEQSRKTTLRTWLRSLSMPFLEKL